MLIGDVPHITFANTGSGRRIISVIIQACEMVNKDEIFSIHLYIYIYIYIPIYEIWNVAECYNSNLDNVVSSKKNFLVHRDASYNFYSCRLQGSSKSGSRTDILYI